MKRPSPRANLKGIRHNRKKMFPFSLIKTGGNKGIDAPIGRQKSSGSRRHDAARHCVVGDRLRRLLHPSIPSIPLFRLLGGVGLIFDFRGCWFVDQKASPGGGWEPRELRAALV